MDAFLISPKQEIDYQQVVIGAAALQVRTITNTKPFPLLFHIKSSSLLTPYVIPSSPEMIVVVSLIELLKNSQSNILRKRIICRL